MPRPKILVVDDSEITLDMVRMHLEDAGYEVSTINSALRLFATIRAQRPELVLLDVKMPDVTGDKAVAILKRHPLSRDVPLVFHSEIEPAQLKRLAAETGAMGYIPKTADGKQLVHQVTYWLAQSRRCRHRTRSSGPNRDPFSRAVPRPEADRKPPLCGESCLERKPLRRLRRNPQIGWNW